MGTKRRRKGFDHRTTKRRKDRIVSKKKKKAQHELELERLKEMEDAQRATRGPVVQKR